MRHLVIKNFGPIAEADVDLNRINVVIGPQSSGKSCLLKVASYCTWVEKRIQLSQDTRQFYKDKLFENGLLLFHKLEGYARKDSYLLYENDTMRFSYAWDGNIFNFVWKEHKWDYICPKVSYIPAERNIVAAVPNWFEVNFNDDNIRNFMSDWETARKTVIEGLPILNFGVKYKYDHGTGMDKVVLQDGRILDFTNTSSGLQSVVPLMVHLEYMYKTRFNINNPKSLKRQAEETRLHEEITKYSSVKDSAETFANYTDFKLNYVFLEEPEQNLFPPTQGLLVEYLKDYARGQHGGLLFVATHSPYVVTSFIEESDSEDISLFFMHETENGSFKVICASKEELQDIYDYDIDVFHNIHNLG